MKKALNDIENCIAIQEKLREEGIILPPDFIDKLIANTMKYYGGVAPSIKSIRAVLKICRYWKKYCIDENEFSKLVCQKVYSMARLHGAAITSDRNDETCYLGKLCILRPGTILPQHTTTSATYGGNSIIQEGFGGAFLEF